MYASESSRAVATERMSINSHGLKDFKQVLTVESLAGACGGRGGRKSSDVVSVQAI